ncbi:hypothetical protein SRABI26_02112 [Arthrobacter sp. Bi26]|nr:hypothetical protein SRABI26_02112 [Arthrobacter sp. Bi26]
MRTCSPKSIGPDPAAGPGKAVTLVSCRLSNNRWKAVPGRTAAAPEVPAEVPAAAPK